jgi:nucleoside-diphosphate kinase
MQGEEEETQESKKRKMENTAKGNRTLILIKPDAVERGLTSRILGRFEDRGFKIVAMKMLNAKREQANAHYSEHCKRDFYDTICLRLCKGPIVAMVLEGRGAITATRAMIGATDPLNALPGTIRGDFATMVEGNVIHGSDSDQSAEKEIGIWFTESDLVKRYN